MQVEEAFTIQIPDEEAFKLQSFSACVEYLLNNPKVTVPIFIVDDADDHHGHEHGKH